MYAFYLSYTTFMIYLPVLRAEQFQFPCKVIFSDFRSNWFNLVSANPPNSQTFNKKESCCYSLQDFWVENVFDRGFDNVCLAEGHTEAAMCAKWWLQKLDLKIMNNVTCLGFSYIEEFTKVATLGASGGIFQILSLYVMHTKIFV